MVSLEHQSNYWRGFFSQLHCRCLACSFILFFSFLHILLWLRVLLRCSLISMRCDASAVFREYGRTDRLPQPAHSPAGEPSGCKVTHFPFCSDPECCSRCECGRSVWGSRCCQARLKCKPALLTSIHHIFP